MAPATTSQTGQRWEAALPQGTGAVSTHCDQLPYDLGAANVGAPTGSAGCRFLKIKRSQHEKNPKYTLHS